MQSIVARYTYDDEEYSVVVTGDGKELNGNAPDIVAARKLADRLVEKIAAGPPSEPVVVHLLDDSAVEFTRAYLDATLFERQPTTARAARKRSPGKAVAEEKSEDNPENNSEDDPAKDTGASSS